MNRSLLLSSILILISACSGNTAAPPFTEDIRVDMASPNDDPDSFGARMCLTDEGHVYVMWMDNRSNSSEERVDIWMNRSLNRGETDSWLQAPVRVNQGDPEAQGPGNVENPNMLCNDEGVFVVWEDDRDGELENHQIYFNRSIDGGETFLDQDILIEDDREGLNMSLEPKLVGYGQDLFVTWYDSMNGTYDIFFSSSGDAGLTWRTPQRINTEPINTAYSAHPQIDVSEDLENIWITWEDSRAGRSDIYFAYSRNGGVSFENDKRLDSGDDAGSADSFEPYLCTDNDRNVYVFWHDTRNSEDGRDIYYNYSDDGGSQWLAEARRLDSDAAGIANSLYPVCSVVGSVAHVAWQDNRFGGYDVFYRQVQDGIPDTSEEVRADLGSEDGTANSLDTVIDFFDDTVAIAWNDGRAEAESGAENGYTDLYYQYSEGGIPFEETDYRIDSMYDGQSFKLDLNFQILGGEWYAAWTDGRGGTSDIYFQRLPLGEEAEPPRADAR
ncbi:MAG TPA: exo-alpha-sialidase [Deltaproteobacteria bacterium]|nr:exo-alpha-sialidase [Deltaproteobacteria bacterium]